MFIIAFFAVFIIGLLTCFHNAKNAWHKRKLNSNTAHQKHQYFITAFGSIVVGFLGIAGLIESAVGVF